MKTYFIAITICALYLGNLSAEVNEEKLLSIFYVPTFNTSHYVEISSKELVLFEGNTSLNYESSMAFKLMLHQPSSEFKLVSQGRVFNVIITPSLLKRMKEIRLFLKASPNKERKFNMPTLGVLGIENSGRLIWGEVNDNGKSDVTVTLTE